MCRRRATPIAPSTVLIHYGWSTTVFSKSRTRHPKKVPVYKVGHRSPLSERGRFRPGTLPGLSHRGPSRPPNNTFHNFTRPVPHPQRIPPPTRSHRPTDAQEGCDRSLGVGAPELEPAGLRAALHIRSSNTDDIDLKRDASHFSTINLALL